MARSAVRGGRAERAAQVPQLDDRAVDDRGIEPGSLTLGTDNNGSAFTSRGFRARLTGHEITHRRGGYCDPESQAFIESWFSKLKEQLVWRSEFETLDRAREEIAASIDTCHHRKQRPEASSATGSRPR